MPLAHARRRRPEVALAAVLLAQAALGPACAIREDEPPVDAAPRVRSVEVVPATVVLEPGAVQEFRAVVRGEGDVPQAVEWRWPIISWPYEAIGTFTETATGLTFRVRATAPSEPITVPLHATAKGNRAVAGYAMIQVLGPAVAGIVPPVAEVVLGESLQFSAVAHPPSLPLYWRVSFASQSRVSPDGLYTAPCWAASTGDAVVVSTSPGGPALAAASVKHRLAVPVLTGYTFPSPEVVELTGARLSQSSGAVVFQDRLGQEVVVRFTGMSGPCAPGSEFLTRPLRIALPPGVVGGPVRVRLDPPGFTPVESNTLELAVPTRIRVRPERIELASGESTRLLAAFLRGDPATPVTWAASAGSVEGGVLTAPVVSSATTVDVRGCPAGGPCAGFTVRVSPFRVEPTLVAAGGSATLSATRAGAPLTATYSVANGRGTVTPEGAFSAPSALVDSGPVWLLAADGTTTLPVQVGIVGLAPGTVGRVQDDLSSGAPGTDLRTNASWGSYAGAVAVRGGTAYVLARPPPPSGDPCWIDVYDLTDPARPAWTGSVASAIPAYRSPTSYSQTDVTAFAVRGESLFVIAFVAGSGRVVERYDLSSTLPAPVSRTPSGASAGVAATTLDETHMFDFGQPDLVADAVRLVISPLAGGPAREVSLALPPAAQLPMTFGATGGSAFASFRAWDSIFPYGWGEKVAMWDLTVDPPLLLATTPLEDAWSSGFAIAGPLVAAAGLCWDTRVQIPSVVPCPWVPVDFAGTTGAAIDGADVVLFEAAVPGEAPVVRARVRGASLRGALRDGRYYSPDGSAGLSVHDLAVDGGPLGTGSWPWYPPYGIKGVHMDGSRLIVAGEHVSAWDTSATAPYELWRLYPGVTTHVDVAGDLLLLATYEGLDVRLLADAASPPRLALVPIGGASALATDGTIAWVGTSGGALVGVHLAAPAGPQEIGRLALGGPVRSLAILGPGRLGAAVAAGASPGEVVVVDASSPATPAVLARLALAKEPAHLVFHGSLGFVTTADSWMTLDFSEPERPVALAEMTSPGSAAGGVTVAAGLAWVGSSSGCRGFDVRNPRWPTLVSELSCGRVVFDGVVAHSLGSSTITRWDLSSPRNVVLGTVPPPR